MKIWCAPQRRAAGITQLHVQTPNIFLWSVTLSLSLLLGLLNVVIGKGIIILYFVFVAAIVTVVIDVVVDDVTSSCPFICSFTPFTLCGVVVVLATRRLTMSSFGQYNNVVATIHFGSFPMVSPLADVMWTAVMIIIWTKQNWLYTLYVIITLNVRLYIIIATTISDA